MYKVVDTFNGYESHKRHPTEESAENELNQDYIEFQIYNHNAIYCKTVVPASYTWFFNGRDWVWG